jgi:heme A synthase
MEEGDPPGIMELSDEQTSFLKKVVPIAAFIGGLCCFTPVVLVLLGLSTVTFAASLSDVLYGQYKLAFIGATLLFLFGALFWYFYKKENICSIDSVKRKRRLIINFTLTALIIVTIAYVIWLYVIVEIIGIFLGLW